MRMWEVLMDRVKPELVELAGMFGEKLPASWKKERMARRAAERMAGDPERLMMLIHRDTMRFMRAALEANPDGFLCMDDVDPAQASEMVHHGALCAALGLVGGAQGPNGEYGLQMTEEWMELLRSGAGWREGRARYLDSVMRCFRGIVETYGALRFEDAQAMLCRCFPKEDAALLRWLMAARPDFCRLDFLRVEDGGEPDWISSPRLSDRFDELYAALKTRANVPYRAFARKQYEFAAEHEWPVYPECYREALDMMVRLGMERRDAEDCLVDAIDMRQAELDGEEDALNMILQSHDWPSLPQVQELIELLVPLMNSVPMWLLKGNSSSEMTRVIAGQGAKILPFPGKR